MPKLSGVLETALYVDDLDRARAFYEEVLGLVALTSDSRFLAFDVGGRNVLLLSPHDGHGPIHAAFAVAADELPAWEKRLGEHRVAIESRTDWPRGGRSIYFRDPDRHLLELVTPGVWTIY